MILHVDKYKPVFFSDWLSDHGFDTGFEGEEASVLASKLRRFYADLRQKTGEVYKRSFLVNVRAGINRHLISPPFERKINLMHDVEFQSANQVFYGVIRMLKQQGLDKTGHKSAIWEEDFKKLYSSGVLGNETPETLLNKVFVEISLHFCRRGREGLRELKKTSFVRKTDCNGKVYISLGFNELEKNHQGFDKRDVQEEPRMYEQEGEHCPVRSFDLYVSELHPRCDAFFQRPDPNFKRKNTWYVNAPLGKNTLCEMMKKMSSKAELSKVYTNHCLRASSITFLDRRGMQGKDICTVSRHKSQDGLRPYLEGPTDIKRFEMSKILHDQSHGIGSQPEKAMLPALPEGTASCSNATGQRSIENSVIPQNSDTCQAVDIPDHNYSTSEVNHVQSSYSAVCDNREAEMMRSFFHGSVFNGNPVFNLSGNFNFH